MKKVHIKWAIIASISLLVLIVSLNTISAYNTHTENKNAFTQKLSERETFYDKMYKTISQKSQVAIKNDSSFKENVHIIMDGRKDAPGIFMKWVTETNPNANFTEVAKLYADLSRAIEGNREGFFLQEKMLQDIKRQDDNLQHRFPANIFFAIMGTEDLKYSAITSTRTAGVIKTGKDDNVTVF